MAHVQRKKSLMHIKNFLTFITCDYVYRVYICVYVCVSVYIFTIYKLPLSWYCNPTTYSHSFVKETQRKANLRFNAPSKASSFYLFLSLYIYI